MRDKIIHGNCITVLAEMSDQSVDAIVTDPPYELGFMGKQWDATGIAYNVELWRELLRVLKPGGHLLAFGGTRTYHRMACAIEDAGFEIRDSIHWVYGSGFPKSLNLKGEHEGLGTALKPAHEPIVLARKPLIGTVAANVLEHGTGALNIDGTRVASTDNFDGLVGRPIQKLATRRANETDDEYRSRVLESPGQQEALAKLKELGRWPANVVHDGSDEVVARFPDNSARFFTAAPFDDTDAASFLYCAKPGKKERNAGLEGLPTVVTGKMMKNANNTGETSTGFEQFQPMPAANFHPTVKPLVLMRWLIRLVTPPNGIVLDPFSGSGTTMVAAILENRSVVGIELVDDYLPIIEGRVAWAKKQTENLLPS